MTQISEEAKMNIDTGVLGDLISLFNEKVNNVKSIFDEINNEMKKIDGTTNIWSGKVQEEVYKDYVTISSSFPKIEEQLRNYKNFLDKTVANYETEENTIDTSINDSDENLNVE